MQWYWGSHSIPVGTESKITAVSPVPQCITRKCWDFNCKCYVLFGKCMGLHSFWGITRGRVFTLAFWQSVFYILHHIHFFYGKSFSVIWSIYFSYFDHDRCYSTTYTCKDYKNKNKKTPIMGKVLKTTLKS